MKKICFIGLGYIGLPTAALVASKGIDVHGVDVNQDVVDTINKGEIHIVEPDLEGLVKYDVERGYLRASTKPVDADVFVIAVPTPFKKAGNSKTVNGEQITDDSETIHHSPLTSHSGSVPEPDISYVEAAVKAIISFLKDGNLVIIESTSPIGTTEKMYELINTELKHLLDSSQRLVDSGETTNHKPQTTDCHKNSIPRIFMAYCPERVLPGQVIYELEHNDRVVGGIDDESTEKACEFYRLFVKGELHKTNSRTAEMCKLTENAYRDVNIAFANELSMICDKADINVYELIKMTNKHPRVNVLTPGCGVGGHCIAVDPWFIVSQFPKEAMMIHAARNTNDFKPEFVIKKIEQAVEEWKIKNSNQMTDNRLQNEDSKELTNHNSHLTSHTGNESSREPVIACLGLAFKPDIDDLRESPALYITEELLRKGYEVMAVEPNIKKHKEVNIYPFDKTLDKADIIVILVKHREFLEVDFGNKIILDFCGIN